MSNKELRKKIFGSLNNDIVENAVYSRKRWENSGHINTYIPIFNILASGRINGGIPLYKTTYLPAPSTMGKSSIGYGIMKIAQKKHNMFCILIDTESRFNYSHAELFGVDTTDDNFMCIQENNINKIKNTIINILNPLDRETKNDIFIFLDSWGGLVSNTTITMAEKDKDTKNMQETQEKNQLAKYLCGSKCTTLVAGWTYENIGQAMAKKKKVNGGTGIEYMPDSIIQGHSANKSDTSVRLTDSQLKKADVQSAVVGKLVKFETRKTSAGGKEESTLFLRILKEGGVDPFYGLLDEALASGIVKKEGNKYTNTINDLTIAYERNIYTPEFWNSIFKDEKFREYIERKFSFNYSELIVNKFDMEDSME